MHVCTNAVESGLVVGGLMHSMPPARLSGGLVCVCVCVWCRWEDFKPVLQVLPSAPTLMPLRLPPFRAPILDTEVRGMHTACTVDR